MKKLSLINIFVLLVYSKKLLQTSAKIFGTFLSGQDLKIFSKESSKILAHTPNINVFLFCRPPALPGSVCPLFISKVKENFHKWQNFLFYKIFSTFIKLLENSKITQKITNIFFLLSGTFFFKNLATVLPARVRLDSVVE